MRPARARPTCDVSLENSEIALRDGAFRLLDLRNSKNGTFLSWKRLPVPNDSSLSGGDILPVGHALPVFRRG